MLGLTFGELFVVLFIVVVVVSAPFWPRVGGAIAVALTRGDKRRGRTHSDGG